MSRNVVSNAQVAHLWANQSQDTARSANGNFWFDGLTLYSYRTPIANLVRRPSDGRLIALLTSKTYSVTTSGKHMGPAWRAVDYGRSGTRMFSVPFIGAPGGQNGCDSTDMRQVHAGNMAHFTDTYLNLVASLKRKRELWAPVLESLQAAADAGRDYCDAFGLDYEDAFDVEGRAAEIEAHRAARDTPAAIAKRERAKAAREAVREAREEREAAEYAARQAELRVRFYEGGHIGYGYNLRDATGGALLRVINASSENGRTPVLQTSLGAEVPLAHAVKVFRFVKLCRDRGEAWHRNGRTIRVGHFQVDRIAADGDFWAGCHRINWPETERLARTLGVFDDAPSAEVVETV